MGTGRYSQITDGIVIGGGGYFFHCDTQYNTHRQTAVGTIHMMTILTSAVWPLSADDGSESGEAIQ